MRSGRFQRLTSKPSHGSGIVSFGNTLKRIASSKLEMLAKRGLTVPVTHLWETLAEPPIPFTVKWLGNSLRFIRRQNSDVTKQYCEHESSNALASIVLPSASRIRTMAVDSRTCLEEGLICDGRETVFCNVGCWSVASCGFCECVWMMDNEVDGSFWWCVVDAVWCVGVPGCACA